MINSSSLKELTYKDPENMMTADTLQALAEIYANKSFREYLMNFRNILIKSLKRISTGTIEGDALKLANTNGRIASIEDIILASRTAFQDAARIKKIKLK